MTKEQIEKYLKEKCNLTEIFAVFPHVRDWIMVAWNLKGLCSSSVDLYIEDIAHENIQSALYKPWETVCKELEENTNEK